MAAGICDRCNIGVDGLRCPKCGRIATPQGGESSRRWPLVAAGGVAVLSVVLALVLLLPRSQHNSERPAHLDELEGVQLTRVTAEPRVPRPHREAPVKDSAAILREDDAQRRARSIEEAQEFGMIGLLNDPRDTEASPPREPSAPSRAPSAAPGIRILAETKVTGQLTLEEVRRTVRQRYGNIRLCYERGLQKDPQLGGKVTLRFGIEPTGAVAKGASASSELADSSVTACLVQLVQELRFPPPAAGTVAVEFPILLTSPSKPTSARAD
jgi:hypothetical protein